MREKTGDRKAKREGKKSAVEQTEDRKDEERDREIKFFLGSGGSAQRSRMKGAA